MAKTKDCPLFKCGNGQWAKKIKGKRRYFGTDLDAALKQWADEKDYLLAGKEPPKHDPSPTLKELANVFDDRCRRRVSDGDLSQRSLDDYRKSIRRLIELLGADCRPERLSPLDFATIKDRLAEPVERTTPIRGGIKGQTVERRSPTTVAGDIRRIRAFLGWASDSELIPAPRYGKEFSPAGRKTLRRHRAKAGRRDMSADEIRATLDKASLHLKPLILLGANAGIGNHDLSEMTIGHLPADLSGEIWIDLPRSKTGAPRRFVLWPETLHAIAAYLAKRPDPVGQGNADRLFLTRTGQAWIRGDGNDRTDAIGAAFLKARRAAGAERGTFYDLRRSFQTVAAETKDFPAVSFVMGHVPPANDMASLYTQAIANGRIRAVCEHVRRWLFGKGTR